MNFENSADICVRRRLEKQRMSLPAKRAAHAYVDAPSTHDPAIPYDFDLREPHDPCAGVADCMLREQQRGQVEDQFQARKPTLCHLDGADFDGSDEDRPSTFNKIKGWHQTMGWSLQNPDNYESAPYSPWYRRQRKPPRNHITRQFI